MRHFSVGHTLDKYRTHIRDVRNDISKLSKQIAGISLASKEPKNRQNQNIGRGKKKIKTNNKNNS